MAHDLDFSPETGPLANAELSTTWVPNLDCSRPTILFLWQALPNGGHQNLMNWPEAVSEAVAAILSSEAWASARAGDYV